MSVILLIVLFTVLLLPLTTQMCYILLHILILGLLYLTKHNIN